MIYRLLGGHSIKLFCPGASYFEAMVEAMDKAHSEIRLETYIFEFDETGEKVAQALLRAASRGVAVQVVVDGVGTSELSQDWKDRFSNAKVQWQRFMPMGLSGWFSPKHWRRLHRKLCVVDGEVLFCGGINVLDDLNAQEHGRLELPRFDIGVRVTGPLVADALHLQVFFWRSLQSAAQEFWKRSAASKVKNRKNNAGVSAALLLRDNFRHRSDIEKAYRRAIATAKTDILICNAYFIPSAKMCRALELAVERGVRVRVLLQGQYEGFMQFHAARAVYARLLKSGVRIFVYTASALHAKAAVVDSQWATVGSSNLDPLSLLLAREANVVVKNEGFANSLKNLIEEALNQGSQVVDIQSLNSRPLGQRFLDGLAWRVMRILLLLHGRRY